MIEIAILLGAASVGYGVARALDQPAIPFLLLAGLALGFTGQMGDEDIVLDALMLGVTFLLFVAGTELTFRRVREYKKVVLKLGITQFVVLSLVGLGAALLLGYVLSVAVYIGLALAASSTLVAVRLLQRRRQMFEPFGRAVTGILLVQDLLIIGLIPIVTRAPEGWEVALWSFTGTLLLLGLSYVMIRWIAPKILLEQELDRESQLLIVLAVLFIFAGLAWLLDVPIFSGVFLAGMALSGFPVAGLVHGELKPIYAFFIAIFFTSLGATIVTPGMVGLTHAIVFSLLVILVTPPLIIFLSEREGLSARPAMENGFLIAQTSEFSLVLGLQGLALGQISADLFTVIALTTAITMVLTPYLSQDDVVKYLMRFHPVSTQETESVPVENHFLFLGSGQSSRALLETIHLSEMEVLVLDEDPAVIDDLREQGVPCIRGDAADEKALESARANRARAIICTLSRPADAETVLKLVDDIPVLVRVFEEDDIRKVRKLGGIPIAYSKAGADAFLKWYDEEIKQPA